jgi:MinD superfamily P-loop ATPase
MPTVEGTFLGNEKRTFTVEIDLARCRSCAVCWDEQVCEPKVLGFTPPFNKARVEAIGACTGCRHCEWLCPDWAIVVRETTTQPQYAGAAT